MLFRKMRKASAAGARGHLVEEGMREAAVPRSCQEEFTQLRSSVCRR